MSDNFPLYMGLGLMVVAGVIIASTGYTTDGLIIIGLAGFGFLLRDQV